MYDSNDLNIVMTKVCYKEIEFQNLSPVCVESVLRPIPKNE